MGGLVRMKIALINGGSVGDIAEFDSLSLAQVMAANMGLIAAPVDDLPITIGDVYMGGRFYRNGEALPVDATTAHLEATVADMAEILVDQEYRLILLELGVV